jgi:hypothetical protein
MPPAQHVSTFASLTVSGSGCVPQSFLILLLFNKNQQKNLAGAGCDST